MKLLVAVVVLALLFIVARLAIHHVSSAPGTIGINDGQLHPCPDSPNCVSSRDSDEEHRIALLSLRKTTTIGDISNTLLSLPRFKIVTQTEDYLHATYTSKWWGFIDDLEFQATTDPGGFHIRSATRVGQNDLGANRKRIESLRTLLQ